MNVKLLKSVKQAILKTPARLNMGQWIDHDDKTAPCGTAACLAGHAVVLSRMQRKTGTWIERSKGLSRYSVEIQAMGLLGLDHSQARKLFYVRCWPPQFKSAVHAIPNVCAETGETHRPSDRQKMAKITAKRIDYFIKTDGTDWEPKRYER